MYILYFGMATRGDYERETTNKSSGRYIPTCPVPTGAKGKPLGLII